MRAGRFAHERRSNFQLIPEHRVGEVSGLALRGRGNRGWLRAASYGHFWLFPYLERRVREVSGLAVRGRNLPGANYRATRDGSSVSWTGRLDSSVTRHYSPPSTNQSHPWLKSAPAKPRPGVVSRRTSGLRPRSGFRPAVQPGSPVHDPSASVPWNRPWSGGSWRRRRSSCPRRCLPPASS